MLLKELENLTNIIDEISEDDISSIFTEEFSLDLTETIFHLIENYIEDNPTAISEPDFHEELLDELKELLLSQFEGDIFFNEDDEEDLDIIIDYAVEIYFTTFSISRSFHTNNETNNETNNISNTNININLTNEKFIEIENKLNKLREKPQPVQRTPEWYTFRHNLITASNAYKVFESQASINQIIYEKCQPLKLDFFKNDKIIDENLKKMVNVNTTLHWGQKYEPLSVLIYEDMYKTKVEDFGCIEHETYKFIGASPDGINIDPSSDRYGRMLEIKNIVNREITGIPKKEYWIQMQIQMEVWDLDECDFLETKFVEYPDSNSFFCELEKDDCCLKGVISYFHRQDGTPFYVYKPLNITDAEEINIWEEQTVDKYQNNTNQNIENNEIKENMVWIKNIYWKLEKLSCVLVLRNRKWFHDNVGQIQKIWNTIEQERVTGYEHRAPVRKIKKDPIIEEKPFVTDSGCLLLKTPSNNS
jgi:putative phage-type endonuclease